MTGDAANSSITESGDDAVIAGVGAVPRTDLAEVDNAVAGAMREISTRYDFKGSKCSIENDATGKNE